MACAKLNAASSQWIGQQSFTQRQGSSSSSTRFATRRVSFPIRAKAYSEELVQTAVSAITICVWFCFCLLDRYFDCFWIYHCCFKFYVYFVRFGYGQNLSFDCSESIAVVKILCVPFGCGQKFELWLWSWSITSVIDRLVAYFFWSEKVV